MCNLGKPPHQFLEGNPGSAPPTPEQHAIATPHALSLGTVASRFILNKGDTSYDIRLGAWGHNDPASIWAASRQHARCHGGCLGAQQAYLRTVSCASPTASAPGCLHTFTGGVRGGEGKDKLRSLRRPWSSRRRALPASRELVAPTPLAISFLLIHFTSRMPVHDRVTCVACYV